MGTAVRDDRQHEQRSGLAGRAALLGLAHCIGAGMMAGAAAALFLGALVLGLQALG